VKLDSERNAREFMSSMKCPLFLLLTFCASSIAHSQATATKTETRQRGSVTTDASIVASAATLASVQKAVQTLGDNALRGKFGYAIENMYPRFKKKQEKVWQQIIPSVKIKIDQGIDVKLKESDVFHNWMFIVPTTQVWTFMGQNGRPPRKAEIKGFQIAVAQEARVPGQEKWSFIEGSGMTTRDLRSVFPSLPVHLSLPKPSKKEIK